MTQPIAKEERTLTIAKDEKTKKQGRSREQTKKRNHITGLLVKICLQEEDIQEDQVNMIWEQPEDLTRQEIDAIIVIYNNIRPFVRHIYPSKCSIASQVPFQVLANAILKSAKDTSNMRAIVPHSSSGTVHALHITAGSLYENIKDNLPQDRQGINSTKTAMSRPDDMFSLVFSTEKIKQKCDAYKLEWIYRIVMVSNGLARLIGKVRDTSKLAPEYKAAKFVPTTMEGSKQHLESHLEELSSKRRQMIESADASKAELQSKKDVLQRIRHEPSNDYQMIRDMKQECHDLQFKLVDTDENLRINKKEIGICKRVSRNVKYILEMCLYVQIVIEFQSG